jgi:hypothetical protein
MFKKKLLALSLSVAMVASLAACGKDDDKKSTDTTPAATQAAEPTKEESKPTEAPAEEGLKSAAADHSSIAAGSIVTFDDGNHSFAAYNEADWAGDKEATVSIVDAFGSKALQIQRKTAQTAPTIAIDVVSLLGDNASKCMKISVDVGVVDEDFAAASGSVIVIAGESNSEIKSKWSVYKKDAACKTVEIDLGGSGLVPGNYLTMDAVTDTGSKPATVILDNLIFYDSAGNALPVDTSVEFAVEGVGEYDWSNGVKQPKDEKLVLTNGGASGGGWWPANPNSWQFTNPDNSNNVYIDPAAFDFGPGSVITVYYYVMDPDGAENARSCVPYLRMQNWDAQDADGNALTDDGSGWYTGLVDVEFANFDNDLLASGLEPLTDGSMDAMAVNKTCTIAQFTFDDVKNAVQQYVDDNGSETSDVDNWYKYCDFIGVADKGYNLFIKAVTIGKAE